MKSHDLLQFTFIRTAESFDIIYPATLSSTLFYFAFLITTLPFSQVENEEESEAKFN